MHTNTLREAGGQKKSRAPSCCAGGSKAQALSVLLPSLASDGLRVQKPTRSAEKMATKSQKKINHTTIKKNVRWQRGNKQGTVESKQTYRTEEACRARTPFM